VNPGLEGLGGGRKAMVRWRPATGSALFFLLRRPTTLTPAPCYGAGRRTLMSSESALGPQSDREGQGAIMGHQFMTAICNTPSDLD
jgi:hypothetical protein